MEKELTVVAEVFVNIEGNLNSLKFGMDKRRLIITRMINTDSKPDYQKELEEIKKIQKETSSAIPNIRKFLSENSQKLYSFVVTQPIYANVNGVSLRMFSMDGVTALRSACYNIVPV